MVYVVSALIGFTYISIANAVIERESTNTIVRIKVQIFFISV